MLYNASDYKFVNVAPVANRIHGNILPIVNPTSPTAQIYFENYLFFLEAFYERYNVEQAGQNTIAVPVRTLDAANMYALNINGSSLSSSYDVIRGPYLGYGSDGTWYINPETTYPQNLVNTVNTDNIYNFLQNFQNQCPELKQPYQSMRPYHPICPQRLQSEFIRAKFWTFQHMTKLLIPLRWGDFATAAISQSLDRNGEVKYQDDINLRNTSYSYVRMYSTYGTQVYLAQRTVVTYKNSFFTFPYATSAVLVWKCAVHPLNGNTQIPNKYVWSTMQLTVSNGAINVPADMIETICDNACTISGMDNNSTIDTYPFYLLVDFEFPARLNGISWNWQPTYT